MEAFGLYSLKASVLLLLFWGIYYVGLRQESFYRFNRFFLLTGMIAALLLPLLTIHYTVKVQPLLLSFNITESDNISPTAGTGVPFYLAYLQQILPVIYLTGCCLLLAARLTGLLHLFNRIRKSNYQQHKYYTLVESTEFSGTFSFFRFICMPSAIHKAEKQIILTHEKAHIRQKHWIDLLLVNLLSIYWWFNPIVWLYIKAIQNNHEYLADQAVLTHYSQNDYQRTLVNQWLKTPVYPMAHSFSYSNQLKRIYMMKKQHSNPTRRLFSLLIFPAIALLLWVFAEPEYVYANTSSQHTNIRTNSIFSVLTTPENPEVVTHTPDTITSQPHKPVGIENRVETPLIVIDGKRENVRMEEVQPADIHSLHVLKDQMAIDKYGEEGKNGVIEITTKKHAKTTGSLSDEEPVNVTGASSLNTDKHPIQVVGTVPEPTLKDSLFMTGPNAPLLIVDGHEVEKGFENINPSDIISISVLKNDASGIYGEKGRNGVVIITTKNK